MICKNQELYFLYFLLDIIYKKCKGQEDSKNKQKKNNKNLVFSSPYLPLCKSYIIFSTNFTYGIKKYVNEITHKD